MEKIVGNTVKPRKQLIFEAAARLFRDKGYSATSMRDLAREVNLRASSLYNHIASKEEILEEICRENAERFLQIMSQVEAMDADPVEKIEELLRQHIRIATQDVTSVTSFNDEWRHLSPDALQRFVALRRDYEQRFVAIIESGIRQGRIRQIDSTIILYTLLSSVRWLYDWFKSGKRITDEEVKQSLSEMILRGITAPAT